MEKEPRIIIPADIQRYCELHTSEGSPVLKKLERETNVKVVYPRMLSGHLMGRFLSMVSNMVQPLNVLEIGTYTGYSAACLAEGLQNGGRVHTIEINVELEDIITRYLDEAGLGNKIRVYYGDAMKIIPGLEFSFDLVFIDASKEHYISYYDLVFDKTRKGGIILADNALWDGNVLAPDDKESLSIAEFNRYVAEDQRVENLLLPVRDGVMIARKR